jgi:hypothetical protein
VNAMMRTLRHGAPTYGDVWLATLALGRAGVEIVEFLKVMFFVDRRPAANRHVLGNRATLWPELLLHYAVALFVSATYRDRRGRRHSESALGRTTRVATLLTLLIFTGVGAGVVMT